VQKVHVENPRSHNQDTDYVALAGQNQGAAGVSGSFSSAVFSGNAGGNTDLPGLTAGSTVDLVPDVGQIWTGLIVANLGNGTSVTTNDLAGLATQVAIGGDSPSDIANLIGPPNLFVCDGPVAVERRLWTGRQLLDGTVLSPISPTDLTAVPADLIVQQAFTGFSSPPICGEVSHYDVTYVVSREIQDVNALTISPPIAIVRPGKSVQLTALLGSTNDSGNVDWFVDGGAQNGSIYSGFYTPPAAGITNQQIVVRAQLPGTSIQAVAYVTMAPPPVLTHPLPVINPAL
jgi:hypothetical protein